MEAVEEATETHYCLPLITGIDVKYGSQRTREESWQTGFCSPALGRLLFIIAEAGETRRVYVCWEGPTELLLSLLPLPLCFSELAGLFCQSLTKREGVTSNEKASFLPPSPPPSSRRYEEMGRAAANQTRMNGKDCDIHRCRQKWKEYHSN